MNNDERMYMLNECIKWYDFVLSNYKNDNISSYRLILAIGKATILKELIEKFIDCQPTKYYKKYNLIVELSNRVRNF